MQYLKTVTLCLLTAWVFACSHKEDNLVDQAGMVAAKQNTSEPLKKWCADCHVPPLPGSHSPSEWPGVVMRMQNLRVTNGMITIPDKEIDRIITYLQTRPK